MGVGFKCVCSLIHLYQPPKPEVLVWLELRAGGDTVRSGREQGQSR